MVNEVGEMDSVSPDDHNNSGISVFEIDSPDYKLNFLSWIISFLGFLILHKKKPIKDSNF